MYITLYVCLRLIFIFMSQKYHFFLFPVKGILGHKEFVLPWNIVLPVPFNTVVLAPFLPTSDNFPFATVQYCTSDVSFFLSPFSSPKPDVSLSLRGLGLDRVVRLPRQRGRETNLGTSMNSPDSHLLANLVFLSNV